MASQPRFLSAHELECKICYEPFDLRLRRPKLLSCQHRLCVRCLRKMADAHQGCVSCPFCRQQVSLPTDQDAGQLPDDVQLLALLSCRERGARKPGGVPLSPPEVLLCPSILEPLGEGKDGSSDCLVITLLEVPEDLAAPESLGVLDVMRLYHPPSLASLAKCPSSRSAWQAVPRFLVGVLCLAYFSSLPFGIYLLLVERLHLGVILVSLVPATLLLCVFYSLCQCLCQEIFAFPS